MASLSRQLAAALRRHRLLPDGGRYLVAVSGGLDSVVLLHALHGLAAAHRWQLGVAHFNHRLRDRAADRDEQTVRGLAAGLEMRFVGNSADVRGYARQHQLSLEAAARTLRHTFLARAAQELGATRVVLAHHADDQAETFFLRLLRGAGGVGLGGMRFASPSPADPRITLVRPLLEVSRADIAAYARRHRLAWRDDASNRDERLQRNWIRRTVLPLLERRVGPALRPLVNRAAQIVAAEAESVCGVAQQWLGAQRRRRFGALDPAVQRRVVGEQLERLRIPPRFNWIEALRLNARAAVSTAAGLVWRDAEGILHRRAEPAPAFDPTSTRVRLVGDSGWLEFGGVRFAWRRLKPSRRVDPMRRRPGREYFDAEAIGRELVLRHWRPGDRFQPLGLAAAAKLQDLFTNARVPRARRHALVVAATRADRIVWVEGLRLGERAKLRPATRRVIEWRWQRGKRRSRLHRSE